MEASRINPDNSAAKEALATALYANGQFERALIQFHRVYRFGLSSEFFLKKSLFGLECEDPRDFSPGSTDARRQSTIS